MKPTSSALLFFFLLVLNVNVLMAQSREVVDSLTNLLNETMVDSTRIKILGQLCWVYAGTRDKLDSAKIYADSIHAVAVRIGEPRAFAYAHFYYGFIDRHKGELVSSLDHFEKYVNYHRNLGNRRLVASGLFQIGVIQNRLGNYDEAMAAYHEVLTIHEEHDYRYGIGFTLNSMGSIQRTIKNYDDARQSFKRAILIFERLDKPADLSMSIENLGNVYAEMGQFESALHYYHRALEIDTKLDKKFGIASELENLGNLYFQMDSLSKALDYQLKSLEIRKNLPQKRELAISLMKVAKIYIASSMFDLAHDYLDQALNITREISARPLMMDIYEQYARLYEAKKDYFQANRFNKQYANLKDSLFNENKINQILALETRYKTAEKDKQIQLLSKENELKEAKAKQHSILRNALFGIIGLVLVLSGTVFYSLKSKLRNQRIISEKNEEIRISRFQQEMAALEMKALRSQMNPHFIFNCMNSINRMILSGENEEASRYLGKFSKLIRLTLENSEQSVTSLENELAMVEAYIQLESIRFKGKINYEITVEETIDPALTNLPSMVLQPFIENSIWHGLMHKSEPGTIRILIRQDEEALKCTIEDDGVGREMALKFADKTNKNSSLGLKITEERIRLISRQEAKDCIQIVDLKDALNKSLGTRVEIRIPLN